MDTLSELSSIYAGLEQDLDLAEMEIASGRFGEARLRFARMTRNQRETPRALLLRARATETVDSRRMLASFVREAVGRFVDPASRAQLAAALAFCGDRASAMETLPAEGGLDPKEQSLRREALEAMGVVPDLGEESEPVFVLGAARKLVTARRR